MAQFVRIKAKASGSKSIKKLGKILTWGVLVLLSIPIFTWLLIQNSQVQTLLVSRATSILEGTLKTKVSIGKVDFRPFNKILLKDVFIADHNADTLLYTRTLTASVLKFNTKEGLIRLHRVAIEEANIKFLTDSTGEMNLTRLLNNLSQDTSTTQPDTGSFSFEIKNIELLNSRFQLSSYKPETTPHVINFEDMRLSDLNLDIRNFGIYGDTIKLTINQMSFAEQSGFQVDNMRCEFSLCSQHLGFEKLRISADGSRLQLPYLYMRFAGWEKMSDFLNEVRFDAKITNSFLKTSTLAYIVPEAKTLDIGVVIDGYIKGPISDVRGRDIRVSTGAQTLLSTNFNLTGLPNIEQTLMVIDIKELSTSSQDLSSIKDPATRRPLIELPPELNVLNKITYKGNFTGFINNFVAYGKISTAIGKLAVDLSIKPDKKQLTNFNGNVSAIQLDLGKLAGSDMLGKINLNARVNGTTDRNAHINALTDATIRSVVANGYNYTNIQINGNLSNNKYVGSIYLDDPNCKLNFLGKVDFSDSIPVFDFSAFVPKIDLVKLNLNTTDSISQASFLFTAKVSGNSIDNSKGEIKVVNSSYRNQNGEFKLSEIAINADNNPDSKLITFKSEFAEGELRSKYNYTNIYNYLENLMYKYIPALSPNKKAPEATNTGVENPEYNDYIIKFRLKKTNKITNIVAPEVKIAENTTLFGILNPDMQTFTFKLKIPEIQIGTNTIRDISVDGQTRDTIFDASISTPSIDMGGSAIRNLRLGAEVKSNTVNLSLGWDNKQKPANYGRIIAEADFNPAMLDSSLIAYLNFKASDFVINDSTWSIAPSNIIIDTAYVRINSFSLKNRMQALSLKGTISRNPSDTLQLRLKNIDLSNLNFYLQSLGYNLAGRIDGYANVNSIYENPTLFADLGLTNIVLNNRPAGTLRFKSVWFNSEKRLALSMSNRLNDTLTFEGRGNLYTESSKIDLNLNISRFLLAHAAPFLQGIVSNMSGSLNGNLRVTGTTDKPSINGVINIDRGRMMVDFMKTTYTITDPIYFENTDIHFKNFKITDRFRRTATLNGAIKTNYFQNIALSLNLAPENFQCLNTTERDNELFYGTVFASGLIAINGSTNDLNINVTAKTEPKTALFLPLPSGGEVSENNFITFASGNPDEIIIEEPIVVNQETGSNLNLKLDLQVTPEAEAQIIIDKKLGDIIKASGRGNFKMEINPYKDIFKMYGDYYIEKGDYLFTLQGVINKKFKIEEGSNIVWNGDPLDANMDIKATYRVKTTLDQLLLDANYKTRVPVDCQILLSQKLMTPSIKFNIDVPNLDSDTRAKVESNLNTEEKINKQFLGLLVINSFIASTDFNPGDQAGGNSNLGTTGLYNTASELLSNQLSNWVSQWSNAFDIGLNYRPGSPNSNLSSDQVELALSTQLLNDRVSINGNVDMGARNTSNPIAGDFNIDIKINKSGKLRFKAFARSNDEILLANQQNNYTTVPGSCTARNSTTSTICCTAFGTHLRPTRCKSR
jgi:hypothetical protein